MSLICPKKLSLGFLAWSTTNRAVQSKKIARGLTFCIKEVEKLYYVAKTKAQISFAVTAKLICVFVFAYAKSRFSHDEALMKQSGTDMISTCSQNPKGKN